jgi:hypothetical protein
MVLFYVHIFILTILILKVQRRSYLGEDLIKAKKKAKEEIFFIIDQIKKNKYSILLLKEQKNALIKEV